MAAPLSPTASAALHSDALGLGISSTSQVHHRREIITNNTSDHPHPPPVAHTAAAASTTTAQTPSSSLISHYPRHNHDSLPLSLNTTAATAHEAERPASAYTPAGDYSSVPESTVTSATTPDSSVGDPWEPLPKPDHVPRQTIIKALASSVSRHHKPESLSLGAAMSSRTDAVVGAPPAANTDTGDNGPYFSPNHHHHQRSPAPCPSKELSDALNSLALSGGGGGGAASSTTPVTALPAMKSPCFYHQRFDDAVNIDKVLEEIKNDNAMSHSRLVQTATGVREVSKQLQRRPIRRAVRSVMIVTKARDNQLVHLTRELATWLMTTPRYGSDQGVMVYVDSQLRGSKRFDAPGILARHPSASHMLKYWTPDLCWSRPDEFDLVLTLGGDGTVLFTSWLFQRVVPPVLSFSLGSLGFLTTFEFEKYQQHLNRVMGDEGMKINLRMRFTCTVWRAGLPGEPMQEGEQFEVLNELVIDRGPSPYVSNMELYGDDELLTVVQADGCIFSTPTGSTAYSLSAGGSLVHPDIPAILLTPICPHTLSFRPMVLSDTMALRVAIPRSSRATAHCAFDGKGRIELRQGDHVTITASQYPFPTVTRTDTEWFDSVSRTLRWNVRAAAQKPFEAGADEDAECDSWDIDTDSGFYASEDGSVSASPIRRQLLEM